MQEDDESFNVWEGEMKLESIHDVAALSMWVENFCWDKQALEN